VNAPVVILNASKSSSDALIMTSSGVKHVPLPDLSFMVVNALVKLIQTATAIDGRNPLLPMADYAQINDLFQRISVISQADSLRFLRHSVQVRHVGRDSEARMDPDDIFRRVLGVLWVSAIQPVICSLNFDVS
jgi:hypothetical protein